MFCGDKCLWPREASSQPCRALLEWALFPAALTLLLQWTHPSEIAPKGGRNTHTVNNKSVNCHQWSEQYYRSLLNHRMNVLRSFSFSLKPCVIGRDRGPICSCPSHIREAWAGLSFLPSHDKHPMTAQPDHPEILTLLNLSTMKQPGPGERGKWTKITLWNDIFEETCVT